MTTPGPPPFALAADLRARGVAVPAGREPVVDALLADASTHLRETIGWQVSPPATVVHRTRGRGGDLLLPGQPVTAVVSVRVDGQLLSPGAYDYLDGRLTHQWSAGWHGVVAVTYTVGYATPPATLVSWACVLASQALAALEDLGALGGGGVSMVALGEFRKAWAEGGDGAGFALPARAEQQLRARYGSGGAFVTGT